MMRSRRVPWRWVLMVVVGCGGKAHEAQSARAEHHEHQPEHGGAVPLASERPTALSTTDEMAACEVGATDATLSDLLMRLRRRGYRLVPLARWPERYRNFDAILSSADHSSLTAGIVTTPGPLPWLVPPPEASCLDPGGEREALAVVQLREAVVVEAASRTRLRPSLRIGEYSFASPAEAAEGTRRIRAVVERLGASCPSGYQRAAWVTRVGCAVYAVVGTSSEARAAVHDSLLDMFQQHAAQLYRPLLGIRQTREGALPSRLLSSAVALSDQWTEQDEQAATARRTFPLGFNAEGTRFAMLQNRSSGDTECDSVDGVVFQVRPFRELERTMLREEGDCEQVPDPAGEWLSAQRAAGYRHGRDLVWAAVESGYGVQSTTPVAILGPPFRGFMLYPDGASLRWVVPDNSSSQAVASLEYVPDLGCDTRPDAFSITYAILSPAGSDVAVTLEVLDGCDHDASAHTDARIFRLRDLVPQGRPDAP